MSRTRFWWTVAGTAAIWLFILWLSPGWALIFGVVGGLAYWRARR